MIVEILIFVWILCMLVIFVIFPLFDIRSRSSLYDHRYKVRQWTGFNFTFPNTNRRLYFPEEELRRAAILNNQRIFGVDYSQNDSFHFHLGKKEITVKKLCDFCTETRCYFRIKNDDEGCKCHCHISKPKRGMILTRHAEIQQYRWEYSWICIGFLYRNHLEGRILMHKDKLLFAFPYGISIRIPFMKNVHVILIRLPRIAFD